MAPFIPLVGLALVSLFWVSTMVRTPATPPPPTAERFGRLLPGDERRASASDALRCDLRRRKLLAESGTRYRKWMEAVELIPQTFAARIFDSGCVLSGSSEPRLDSEFVARLYHESLHSMQRHGQTDGIFRANLEEGYFFQRPVDLPNVQELLSGDTVVRQLRSAGTYIFAAGPRNDYFTLLSEWNAYLEQNRLELEILSREPLHHACFEASYPLEFAYYVLRYEEKAKALLGASQTDWLQQPGLNQFLRSLISRSESLRAQTIVVKCQPSYPDAIQSAMDAAAATLRVQYFPLAE